MPPTPQKPILRAEDLGVVLAPTRFTERPREILRSISLQVAPGESLAILGGTGSGKSILCRALTRLVQDLPIRELRGAVWFENRNLLETGPSQLAQLRGNRIAHLLQNAGDQFHPHLTIAQHFKLLFQEKFGGRTDQADHAMDSLYQIGIVDPDELLRERVFPRELDAATRQRIMIALTLSCEPDVLIADEPVAELEGRSLARIGEVFERRKRERGLAVLVTTGRMPWAERLGDTIGVLDQGTIVESGSYQQLVYEAKHPSTRAFLEGTLHPGRSRERLVPQHKETRAP